MRWVRVSARLHAIRGDGSRRCCEWRVSARPYTVCGDGGRQSISTRSSTVPGGDTPCLTAGDARRVNPWRGAEAILRHRRCRTASTAAYPSFSLHAFSATPPDSFEYSSICPILGFVSIVLDLHDGEEKGDALCEGKRWENLLYYYLGVP